MKYILFLLVVYFIIIFFSVLSEITYKKRKFSVVLCDLKNIVIKSTIVFLVLLIFTYLYYLFGGKVE